MILPRFGGRSAFVLVLAVTTVGCASRTIRELRHPIPEQSPLETAPERRGDEASARAIAPPDQVAIASLVVRSFFRPPPRQARWIDPQLLAHRRATDADSLGEVEFEWAESVVKAIGLRRVCTLDVGDEACRGLPGGVLRFSNAYAFGPDVAVVFVRYIPVGPGESPPSDGGFELEFRLARRGADWQIVSRRSVGNFR